MTKECVGNVVEWARDARLSPTRTIFDAAIQLGHPAVEEGMDASGAAEVLTARVMAQQIVPVRQFQHLLARVSIVCSGAFVHRDPPAFRIAH
jgi:hypothetical protein